MAGTVYVVHCVDTEGPLYEDNKVIFEQIKKIYGIDIPYSDDNLKKILHGELHFGVHEKDIYSLVGKMRKTVKGSWAEIENALSTIISDDFRNKVRDSNGGGWIYNWFCMDHVGFWGENPRRKDAGHHKIFDYYSKLVKEQKKDDIVQFHHHPVSHSGNYHECGTAYWGRSTLNDILTRKIIDRSWFPTAYRPGFHTERPDSHWFLEQWIPFDYANQSGKYNDMGQLDLDGGRGGDWRRAPLEWKPYHPAYEDYQVPGGVADGLQDVSICMQGCEK